MNSNTKKIALAFFLALLILGIGRYLMPENTARDYKTSKAVLAEKWQLSTIGTSGLLLKVPSSLKQIPTKLDGKAAEILDSYDTYEYSEGNFGLRINKITAKTDMSAENYAKQLTGMLNASPDLKGYDYKITDFEKDGMSGVLVRGSALQNDAKLDMNSMVIVNGPALWEISISYPQSEEELRELAIEIFDSAEIR